MKKQLHIISDGYPFGTGEQFFENEVIELSKKFDAIVIYPLAFDQKNKREIPVNVKVNTSLAKSTNMVSIVDLFKNMWLVLSILSLELYRSKRRGYILKHLKELTRTIIRAKKQGDIFHDQLENGYRHYYYSFWMNNGALMLSILKRNNRINDFQFRVNGFDIFDERRKGLYMPYRFFNFKMVKQVFVLSNPALVYLKEKQYYPEKLKLAHYGIYEKGINPFKKGQEHHIVSCSNLIPIKRIDKIINALNLLDLNINWTHFGGGVLLSELKDIAKDLPDNIHFEFKGNKPHADIIDFYRSTPVSLFVHTSETEGLGMAIIEAQSFGIPAVVIGVGGVVDIVEDSTGIVLNPDCSIEDLAEAIREGLIGNKSLQEYRANSRSICHQKFDAKANYKALYHLIIGSSFNQ